MHVEFEIQGRYDVPEGTQPVAGTLNLFRLPTGQIVSVHPVIEMATATDSDDHRDLSTGESATFGIHLDLYDRSSTLGDD
ncbi:hypothetical protein [Sphingobium sp.]|uniref:hypothetical protein n=1 Tax=Sphingobium sp. TaxID=1912891 RepID=UPI002E1DDF64